MTRALPPNAERQVLQLDGGAAGLLISGGAMHRENLNSQSVTVTWTWQRRPAPPSKIALLVRSALRAIEDMQRTGHRTLPLGQCRSAAMPGEIDPLRCFLSPFADPSDRLAPDHEREFRQ